jgi:hypothetical protein
VFMMDAQILANAKVLLDAIKIEPFNENNFKRWQQKVLAVLDFTKISCALHEPKLGVEFREKAGKKSEKLKNWEMANTLCLNTILNSLSNDLFDVFDARVAKVSA